MKKILSFILLLVLFAFIAALKPLKNVSARINPDANGNYYYGYKSKLDESYYSSLSGITDVTAFKKELGRIISTGVKKLTYGGGSTAPAIADMDEDPNNSNNALCMYTGVSYPKSSANGKWNQEHTWAKSHGFPEKSYNAYSDIHHLRVTEKNINSSRSNSDFGEVDHSSSKSDSYGNFWTSTTFEPRDAVKGDVARIIMYMETRYQPYNPNTQGLGLEIVNTKTTNTKQPKLAYLDILKKWHEEDPVDDLERRRNDVGQSIQGNRNPFIDHPEYADIIYGTKYQEKNQGGPISRTYSVNFKLPTGASFNYTDSTEYNLGDKIKNPSVLPTMDGYVFKGWYTTQDYKTLYDFNEAIKGNVTLYALFEEKPLTFKEYLAKVNVSSKLVFSYEEKLSEGSSLAEDKTVSAKPTSGQGAFSGLSTNQVIDVNQYFDSTVTALFDFKVNTNAKPNFYIKAGELRLYGASGNGTALIITAKNGLSIKNIKAIDGLTINVSGQQAIIQNKGDSGNIKVNSLEIDYVTNGSKVSLEMVENSLYVLYRLPILTKYFDADAKLSNFKAYNGNNLVSYEISYSTDNSICYLTVVLPVSSSANDLKFTYNELEFRPTYQNVKEIATTYLKDFASDSAVKKYQTILETLAK